MSTSPALSIGPLLRRYRRGAHFTQEELAERAGISVDTVSALERGVSLRPRRDTIDQLADALNLDPTQRTPLYAAAYGLHTTGLSAATVSPPGDTGAPPIPLVGRTRELTCLEQHLAGEGPPVFLLAGEPGIGKTRLLMEAVSKAQSQGWTVLDGGCYRRINQDSYVPVVTALERRLRRQPTAQIRTDLDGCAWLVHLLPELGEGKLVPAPSWNLPSEQERRLMFGAVARYLTNIAGPRGTLLVLDDLQWASADAFDLLSSLLHTPAEIALRIVGAYRSTEVLASDPLGAFIAEFARLGLATQHSLGALADSEAQALLDILLDRGEVEGEDGDEPVAQTLREPVLARTGGVPYFLVSCAQALRMPGMPGLAEGDQSIPWDVAESIRQRVAALPRTARDVLGIVAIAGDHAPRRLLVSVAGALGQSEHEVLLALEAACQARLLVEAGANAYAFPHDLIHDVQLGDLSAVRRATLHRHVAEALEQLPQGLSNGRAAELTWHWLEAENAERALPAALRAGHQAETVYAYQDAQRYYALACTLAQELGDQHQEAAAREHLGAVLVHLARFTQAQEQLEAAVALHQLTGDVEKQGRALARLGEAHAIHGNTQIVQRGIACMDAHLPSLCASGLSLSGQAKLQIVLAHLYLFAQSTVDSCAAAEQGIRLAQRANNERLLSLAHMWRGTALIGREHHTEGMVALEAAITIFEATGDLEHLLVALYNLARGQHIRGEFEESRRTNERVIALVEQTGDLQALVLALHGSALLDFLLGDWRHMREVCDRARLLTQHEREFAFYSRIFLFHQGILLLAEGNVDAASRALDEVLVWATENGVLSRMLLIWVLSALAEWDVLEGRSAEARVRLDPLRAEPGHTLFEEDAMLEMLPLLAHACAEQGDIGQAEHLLQEALTQARAWGHRLVVMDVRRAQGLIALRTERYQEAAQALEEAQELCQNMRIPYEEAKTLYYAGTLSRASGKPAQARQHWQAALTILNRLGERLYAAHVERGLAELEHEASS